MDNILLLTNEIDKSPTGGRELLCKLNHDILKESYGDQCTVFELPKNSISGLKDIFNAFKGCIDGLNSKTMIEAFEASQTDIALYNSAELKVFEIIKG